MRRWHAESHSQPTLSGTAACSFGAGHEQIDSTEPTAGRRT